MTAQGEFDITVIPPGTVGGEYVKTKGHHHPLSPSGIGYPELYQVLAGEALYLLQRSDLGDIVAAKAREFILILPGYGHVTANPGREELVTANLVSAGFISEYTFYEQMQGGAYYLMEEGEWVRNPRYPAVLPMRMIPAGGCPGWASGMGGNLRDGVAEGGTLVPECAGGDPGSIVRYAIRGVGMPLAQEDRQSPAQFRKP